MDWTYFIQIASAFIMLFAIIDPLGSMPIVLNLEQKGDKVNAWKVTIATFLLMLAFLFAGEWMLRLFHIDIESFAVAGAFIIFLMAIEMVCDVELFKNNGPKGSSSIVPLAFPLFAGPGVMTALLTLRSEYDSWIIVVALMLNMIAVWLVCHSPKVIQRLLGESGIYIIRKFFGIIVMAIAVKLFSSNIMVAVHKFRQTTDAVPIAVTVVQPDSSANMVITTDSISK